MQKIWLSVLLFISVTTFAQSNSFVYENKVYLPNIKTVQCYNSNKEQSIPVITLNSKETIAFAFDDLLGGTQNYWYAIEHCTSDWKSSNLSTIDYLESFSDDRILDYSYSFNTTRKYTHYDLTLPNNQIRPKIAGNYLLKVYLDGDLKKPVISQRFYILENQFGINAEITNSLQVADRNSKQKINFTIMHPGVIPNPYQDIKAVVMQNFNSNTAQTLTKPAFIRQNQLVYNDITTSDFWAGNEFRKFDTRSLRFKGDNVRDITREKESVSVVLFQDLPRNSGTFANQFDENGNFFIRNTDGRNDKTEAEYMGVVFSLKSPAPSTNGEAYVVGRFNNFTLSNENKLLYDVGKNLFYGNILLKQGLYDYEYVWVDSTNKISDPKPFEGAYFQTENSYQIFVYYRKPGGRWESLLGYVNLSNRITDKR